MSERVRLVLSWVVCAVALLVSHSAFGVEQYYETDVLWEYKYVPDCTMGGFWIDDGDGYYIGNTNGEYCSAGATFFWVHPGRYSVVAIPEYQYGAGFVFDVIQNANYLVSPVPVSYGGSADLQKPRVGVGNGDSALFIGGEFVVTEMTEMIVVDLEEPRSGSFFKGVGLWQHEVYSDDCNGDGVADLAQIRDGSVVDADDNGIPDTCDQPDESGDCDGNGVLDQEEINADPSLDSNNDGFLDACAPHAPAHDCNCNSTEDADEIDSTTDADGDGILDECQGDNLGGAVGSGESGLDDVVQPEDKQGYRQYDRNGDGIKDGCGTEDYTSDSGGPCCDCVCDLLTEIRDMMKDDHTTNDNVVKFGENYASSIDQPDYPGLPSSFDTTINSPSFNQQWLPEVGKETGKYQFKPAGYYSAYMPTLTFSTLLDTGSTDLSLSGWVMDVRPIVRAFILISAVIVPALLFISARIWSM